MVEDIYEVSPSIKGRETIENTVSSVAPLGPQVAMLNQHSRGDSICTELIGRVQHTSTIHSADTRLPEGIKWQQ